MTKKINPITIIRASAGTGKTYRLASEFIKLLQETGISDGEQNPAEIITTTFTNRAAIELTKRIRRFLIQDGDWESAQTLFASRIGTVNSICGSLVSELAIEAGLSPNLSIIAEEQQKELFDMAVEGVFAEFAQKHWRLLNRLGKENEWRDEIRIIAQTARANKIGAERLLECGKESWTRYKELLPELQTEAMLFEPNVRDAIERTISALPFPGDSTKTTQMALQVIQEIDHEWESTGVISWQSIIKLSKTKPGKGSKEILETLHAVARDHISTPEFQGDIQHFIKEVFRCACECLTVYADFKTERGLMDFVDQEEQALNILEHPDFYDLLKSKFSILLVDEFQDTNPLQLSVFLEISKIVGKSIWVGDEKQSIFAFRGADPILMRKAADELIPLTGGHCDQLSTSYRSRPELVEFVNKTFSRSMPQFGFLPEDIQITKTARLKDNRLNDAVHMWWLEGSKKELSFQSLANALRKTLLNSEAWMVTSDEQEPRPIRGSDIAVLCRTNQHKLEVANALSNVGILVSTERPQLLNTPECILALAVVRFLADKYDTLAAAEIVRFTDEREDGRQWLYDWLSEGTEQVLKSNLKLTSIDKLRLAIHGLTPLETLQLAATSECVLETISRWGNRRQRLLNLEALTGLAWSYEELCLLNKLSASVAGLITYLSTISEKAHQPPSPDTQAVQLLTYHQAKGLEWPMVVMFDLGSPRAPSPFGVHTESLDKDFDPQIPLNGRVVRYWPNPYGLQEQNTDLIRSSQNSIEMKNAQREHQAENLRLLYVGMTRARDYLVLACRKSRNGTGWLDLATDESGKSIFQLSQEATGHNAILHREPEVNALYCTWSPNSDDTGISLAKQNDNFAFASPIGEPQAYLPYSCSPSRLHVVDHDESESIIIDSSITIGARLPVIDEQDIRNLGDAVHNFLAVDDYESCHEERLFLAKSIIDNFAIQSFTTMDLVEASTRLKEKLDELYPNARWLREWPVTGRYGLQRLTGTIDLLLDLPEGLVIVDHKCYPGKSETWEARAISHYPQLDAYAQVVKTATSKNVIATYIHMPIVGKLLGLKSINEYTSQESTIEDNWLIM